MTHEGELPVSPLDLTREELDKAIANPNLFDGIKVLSGLDKLQNLLAENNVSPIDSFTELAMRSDAAKKAREEAGDMMQANMFGLRAENYMRTATLLNEQARTLQDKPTQLTAGESATISDNSQVEKVEQAAPKRRGRPPKISTPTNTATLPSTGSAKR